MSTEYTPISGSSSPREERAKFFQCCLPLFACPVGTACQVLGSPVTVLAPLFICGVGTLLEGCVVGCVKTARVAESTTTGEESTCCEEVKCEWLSAKFSVLSFKYFCNLFPHLGICVANPCCALECAYLGAACCPSILASALNAQRCYSGYQNCFNTVFCQSEGAATTGCNGEDLRYKPDNSLPGLVECAKGTCGGLLEIAGAVGS